MVTDIHTQKEIVLALDTSGERLALALWRPDGWSDVLVEQGARPSNNLQEAIKELLGRNSVLVSDLGLISVCNGPGSFTGIRLALAAAEGLALPYAIPLVSVTVFESLLARARAEGLEGAITCMVNAMAGDVFIAGYTANDNLQIEPACLPHGQALQAVLPGHVLGSAVTLHQGELPEGCDVHVGEINHPDPLMLAQIGWQRRNQAGPVEPYYLKKLTYTKAKNHG